MHIYTKQQCGKHTCSNKAFRSGPPWPRGGIGEAVGPPFYQYCAQAGADGVVDGVLGAGLRLSHSAAG